MKYNIHVYIVAASFRDCTVDTPKTSFAVRLIRSIGNDVFLNDLVRFLVYFFIGMCI